MNYLQINFEKWKSANETVIAAVERVFSRIGLDYYLIGAQSRDLWIAHLGIIERDKNLPYRFYLEGYIMDLIPFGALEVNGEVVLEEPTTELSVYGCLEATEEAVKIGTRFKVVMLPGLCTMKLIAFDEKPGIRAKDWDDFLFIMANCGEIAGEKLFDGSQEDLFNDDFDLKNAAARMLGRHMQPVLNRNAGLKKKIVEILKAKLPKFSFAEIDLIYAQDKHDHALIRMKLITETIRGINDNLRKENGSAVEQ